MKSYNEIAKNILERRDNYEEAKRTKRQNIVQISTAAVCLVILSCIGFGIGRKNWLKAQIAELMQFQATIYTVTNDSQAGDDTTANPPKTTAPTTKAPSPATNPHTQALTTTTVGELYYEIDWEKKSMPGKFCAVRLNHTNYISVLEEPGYSGFTEYVYPFRPQEERATTRNASLLITDMQIEALEPDGTVHTALVDIFALEGLSENLALGVRFSDDDRIYTYVNSSYRPETLGEFLAAIDYDNTVTYGGIMLYPGNNFPVNSANAADIKSYLLSDASLVNIQDMAVTGNCVTASIYCRELGRENKVFIICENGYIFTNLIGYEYSFYAGKEAVNSFLKDSYNITFEQIKELTGTTQPLITTAPTTEPTTTPTMSPTTTMSSSESSDAVTSAAAVIAQEPPVTSDVTTTDVHEYTVEAETTTWFCGTVME